MPQPAYNNLCWSQVESDEARRHLHFQWYVNFCFYLGEALFAAPSFSKLHLKTINFFICIIVCSGTINKNFGNESYFKFCYGNFSYTGESSNATPKGLMTVEAASCLNVTAFICPNNLRLIIICRLGTCVRSTTNFSYGLTLQFYIVIAQLKLHR
jgi:hypothetical protein